jgi:uncharacterized repeat protein (TIGR02543 family)
MIYHANDGTNTTVTDNQTYNAPYTVRSNTFSRPGYIFKGWSTSSNGPVSDIYVPGSSHTRLVAEPFNLYAIWQPQGYSVIYKGNGGTRDGKESWSQPVAYGISYTVQDNSFTNGTKKFVGWSTSSTTLSGSYAPGSGKTFNSTSNIELYALWLEKPSEIYIVEHGKSSRLDKVGLNKDIDLVWTCNVWNGGATYSAKISIIDEKGKTLSNIDSSENLSTNIINIGKLANINGLKASKSKKITIKVTRIVSYNFGTETITEFQSSHEIDIPLSAGTLRVKKDNIWQEGQVFIKNGGEWKEATAVYIKQNGIWAESN